MITSSKNYTKKKRQTETRTNGKSKAIQKKSYKAAYTYTLKKGKKYIYKKNRKRATESINQL